MNLSNADKLELIRFNTSDGFKFYIIDGGSRFEEVSLSLGSEPYPTLGETAELVKTIGSRLDYIPYPNKWKLTLNDYRAINKDLSINDLNDTWDSYDLVEYGVEASRQSVDYTSMLNSFIADLAFVKETCDSTQSDLTDLYLAAVAAGQDSALTDLFLNNANAVKSYGESISSLRVKVEQFRDSL